MFIIIIIIIADNANFYFPIHNNNLKHNATESSYGQPTLFIVPSAEQGSSSTVQSFFRNITHTIQIWQFYSFRIVYDHLDCFLTLGRPGRGGGYHPPWRFSPVTFLMIPTAKIASSYLILGMRDTFWHMWHHLDAVTWHMSWRHMYMTVVKIQCFYHCLLIEISFDVDVTK